MPVSVLLVSELIISGQNKQVQFVVFVMMIETIYNTQNLTVVMQTLRASPKYWTLRPKIQRILSKQEQITPINKQNTSVL
jgi:hypothetical protein